MVQASAWPPKNLPLNIYIFCIINILIYARLIFVAERRSLAWKDKNCEYDEESSINCSLVLKRRAKGTQIMVLRSSALFNPWRTTNRPPPTSNSKSNNPPWARLKPGSSISNPFNKSSSRNSLNRVAYSSSSPSSIAVTCIPHQHDSRINSFRQQSTWSTSEEG